jgi:RNA ligase
MLEFKEFPKIPRLYKGHIVVTEKIDGTNARIAVIKNDPCLEENAASGDLPDHVMLTIDDVDTGEKTSYRVFAGSKNRWLSERSDNFGFYKWMVRSAYELAALGEGEHVGEWWGNGIQRNYGAARKNFSLFNTGRWYDPDNPISELTEYHKPIPRLDGLSVVPVLYHGPWFGRPNDPVQEAMRRLEYSGSTLNRQFKAEGVMVYHEAAGLYFKAPFDPSHKGVA